MKINEMIKEKRLALGLTQSYIADHLGVSTQAVSKWEKGTSHPDVILLPILARLLKVNMDTLFSFNETLSELEIYQFIRRDLVPMMKSADDYDKVFNIGMAKVREFPNCEQLAQLVALQLENFLLIYEVANPEKYQAQIDIIFEQLVQSDDFEQRYQTILNRVPVLLDAEKYGPAETMIKLLPEKALDRRIWEGEVYLQQKRIKEAANVFGEKLVDLVNDLHFCLVGLSQTANLQQEKAESEFFENTLELVQKTFGIDEWEAYNARLDVVLAKNDIETAMLYLRKAFDSAHILVGQGEEDSNHPFTKIKNRYGKKILGNLDKIEIDPKMVEAIRAFLVEELKNHERFEAVRQHPEYKKLLMVFEGEKL